MAEKQQVMKEPQPVTTKEPKQVTTKNSKKVEVGKRLAVHNRRKREEKKRVEQAQAQKSGVNQYYGIGAVIVVGVTGGLGYYIYQTKRGGLKSLVTHFAEGPTSGESPPPQRNNPPQQPLQTNKFEMD